MPSSGSPLVESAVTQLADEVRLAHQALSRIEYYMEFHSPEAQDYKDQAEEEFALRLKVLGRRLPVLLDLVGMKETRDSFVASWESYAGDLGETELFSNSFDFYLGSKPLRLVGDIMHVLGAASRKEDPSLMGYIKTLEYVLAATPQILRTRGIIPAKEFHVQRALNDHLKCTFPEYSTEIAIARGPKGFKPDGAVPPLKALIELKFVDSDKEVATAFSGIMEDQSGYGGLKDWTRFYSLVYQTGPFVNERRFKRALKLSGNSSWKAVVVTGPGGRKKAKKA